MSFPFPNLIRQTRNTECSTLTHLAYGFRNAPSSQEIRRRNSPANSRGDPTRESEKQQRVSSWIGTSFLVLFAIAG